MTLVRATAVIDAPEGAVRRVLRRADVWTRTARATGARAEVASAGDDSRAPLRDGALLRMRPAARRRTDSWFPRRSLLFRVHIDEEGLPGFSYVAGPLTLCGVRVSVSAADGGTLVTVEGDIDAVTPPAALAARRRALEAARILLGITLLAAREPLVVVAAAVVDNGRVLAARRIGPPALAGKWELPGGKVQPGETERAALRREIVEELGLTVTVGHRIGHEVELEDGATLRCYTALVASGRLTPREHDSVRWLPATELDDVDWLPADRRLLDDLRRSLAGSLDQWNEP